MNNFPSFQQQGRTPSWWFQLKNTVLKDKDNRTIYLQFRLNLSQHEAHCNINQPILPTTKIDSRRNNWVVYKRNKHNQIRIGLLVNQSDSTLSGTNFCVFQHFSLIKQLNNMNLIIKHCTNSFYSSGTLDSNNFCHITIEKSKLLYINSKVTKERDTYILKQSYISFLIELDLLERSPNERPLTSIDTSPYIYRKLLYKKIYSLDNTKTTELLNIFSFLLSTSDRHFKVYTIPVAETCRNYGQIRKSEI
jgi:hypothetical protein